MYFFLSKMNIEEETERVPINRIQRPIKIRGLELRKLAANSTVVWTVEHETF